MDPRKLKRLLDTYRDAGVSEVTLDEELRPTSLKFAAMSPPLPTGEVEGDVGTLELPTGVPDAAAVLARIRKAYEPQKGRAS